MTVEERAEVDVARVQRRTLGVLSGGVALAGVGVTVGITRRRPAGPRGGRHRHRGRSRADRGGARARRSSPSRSPGSATAPAAVPGWPSGYAVAVLGAGLTVVAAMLSSLPLLLLGLFTFGASTACRLQARYAAADLAEPERRGRSLSLGRLGHHRRLGPRTQPRRAGRRPRPVARHPRAQRRVRGVAGGLRRRRRRVPGCCCGPTRCCCPVASAAARARRPCGRGGPRSERSAPSGAPRRAGWASRRSSSPTP